LSYSSDGNTQLTKGLLKLPHSKLWSLVGLSTFSKPLLSLIFGRVLAHFGRLWPIWQILTIFGRFWTLGGSLYHLSNPCLDKRNFRKLWATSYAIVVYSKRCKLARQIRFFFVERKLTTNQLGQHLLETFDQTFNRHLRWTLSKL